jgi:hypothetical protein
MEKKVVNVPNDKFLPAIISLMAEQPGRQVTIPLRGRSMRPFLEDGRDKALLALPAEPCRKNDPVLAEIAPGHFVLHRITDITPDGHVTLKGDGNLNTEHCTTDDIRAKATAFIRKGRNKPDYVTGRKWRTYSWFWTRLAPIRRYLLFVLYPHVPRCMKRHKA